MNEELITVKEYCVHYQAEADFVNALEQNGLITYTIVETEPCIRYEELHLLETYSTWYYEMHINVEGIDALANLLQKMKTMQQQLNALRSRLRSYELSHTPQD